MPIVSIEGTSAAPSLKVTCSECLVDTTIDGTSLVLGNQHDPNGIVLPPCACGAQEILHRTFDVHPIEERSGHRKKVNALAAFLKSAGHLHSAQRATITLEQKAPAQVGPLLGSVPLTSLDPKVAAKFRPAPRKSVAS